MGKMVFVHFSFRRPSHKKYGIFAVSMYGDQEGRKFLGSTTRAFRLWKDQQYITAIQSYEHALYCIWENQKKMQDAGVTDVMLVTDNSTLAKWIEEPDKRPDYAQYMKRANKNYTLGGDKSIYLNIGLCEPLKSEKSHKFCREELIQNKKPAGYDSRVKTDGMRSVMDVINAEKVDFVGIDASEVFKDSEGLFGSGL